MGIGTSADVANAYVPSDDNADIDPNNAGVQTYAIVIYCVGIVLWLIMWHFMVGYRESFLGNKKPMLLGFFFAIVYLCVNAWLSTEETIGHYSNEKAEAHELDRNSFYIVASLFTFSQLLAAHQGNSVREALPFIMAGLFFSVFMVLTPTWVSTIDPKQTIRLKHTKTVFTIWGIGFIVSILSKYFIDHRYGLGTFPQQSPQSQANGSSDVSKE